MTVPVRRLLLTVGPQADGKTTQAHLIDSEPDRLDDRDASHMFDHSQFSLFKCTLEILHLDTQHFLLLPFSTRPDLTAELNCLGAQQVTGLPIIRFVERVRPLSVAIFPGLMGDVLVPE